MILVAKSGKPTTAAQREALGQPGLLLQQRMALITQVVHGVEMGLPPVLREGRVTVDAWMCHHHVPRSGLWQHRPEPPGDWSFGQTREVSREKQLGSGLH